MPAWTRTCCTILVAVALHGCALPYYWQAIGGQIEILRKREPIAEILADETRDEELRSELQRVSELRRFAVDELGLANNDSYTSYVDLQRPYVVWNVIATEPLSIDPMQWCYPFVGCVSYRGYFARSAAESLQRKLDERNLDTFLGGSGAYSTLGYFDDPILSTMLVGGARDIAGILFHELAHQRLYIRDDSEISEGFATTIEEYGVESWLTTRSDPASLEEYRRRIARRADFAELVTRQQARLAALFAAATDDASKLAAKDAAFEQMRVDYADLKDRWGGAAEYDQWFAQPLNNATLVAVATYRRWVPAMRERLDRVGLDQFYLDMEVLAALPEAERLACLGSWQPQVSAAGGLSQASE
jgi:predicted aminopeptidase